MSAGNLYSCVICKSEIFTNSLTRHYRKCIKNDASKSVNLNRLKRVDSKCIFCNKEFSLLRGTFHHELYCLSNPDRISGHKTNQFIKAEQLGLPKPICSEETKIKLRNKNLGKNSWWHWKNNAEELRKNHSISMLTAVQNNPESYSTRHNSKYIKIDDVSFDSSWEVLFYNWCFLNSIKCLRCQNYFLYTWEDNQRNYFPDFYLPELKVYVEIKGYETQQDLAKWSSVKETLIILREKEIKRIKNNDFLIEHLLNFVFQIEK